MKKIMYISFVVTILFFKNNIVYAEEKDKYIFKEEIYQTTDENEKRTFQNIIQVDNKKYKLVETNYQKLSEELAKHLVSHNVIKDNLYSQDEVELDNHLEVDYNGKKINVFLKEKTFTETTIENRKETVTANDYYYDEIKKPNVNNMKSFTFFDEKSNKEVNTVLRLKEVIQEKPYEWVQDIYTSMTITIYNSRFFKLGEKYLEYNKDIPNLKGQQEYILELLNLPKDSYKVDDFYYSKDEEVIDDVVQRQVNLKISRLITNYKVVYESETNLPNVKGYKLNALYQNFDESDLNKFIYTIKATSKYELVEQKQTINESQTSPVDTKVLDIVILSLFLLLILLCIVIIIYKLKKKEEKENK